MVAGFILTGLGGLGSFYLGRVVRNGVDLKHAAKEQELISKVGALQKSNGELRRQVELYETMPASTALSTGVTRLAASSPPATLESLKASPDTPPAAAPTVTPDAKTTRLQAAIRPSPVKMSAPPLTKANSATEWTEAPTLEEMVAQASSPAAKKSSLSEYQRQEIGKVLRRHSGKAIAIHTVAGDSSGLVFAQALRQEFIDAGWHVGSINQIAYAKPPVGLYVSAETFPSPEEVIAAYQALTAAGLTVSQQLDPKMNGEKAVVLVGATLK